MRKVFCLLTPVLFLIGTLALILNGCRKDDQALEKDVTPEIQPPTVSSFYNTSQDVDPTITAVVKNIKERDVDGKIESKLLLRAGNPIWNKSIIVAKRIPTANRGSDANLADSVKLVLIPFVPEGSRQTKAILEVKMRPNDTTYQLIYASQYKDYGFEEKGNEWNARNLFHIFTRFDKSIFGYSKFVVKDKRILSILGDVEGLAIVEQLESTTSNRIEGFTFCNDYTICLQVCPSQRSAQTVSVMSQPCCQQWGVQTVCTTIWVEVGDGGGDPPPGDGGGGGGGGGGVGDPCDEERPARLGEANRNEPCDGESGWEPHEPDYAYEVYSYLNLSTTQYNWLTQNDFEAQILYNFLDESLSDEAPNLLPYSTYYSNYTISAVNVALAAAMNNRIYGPYDNAFWNIINPHLPTSIQTSIIDPVFMLHFTIQCIILKMQHPEWGKYRLFTEAMKETVHTMLDAAGMVPGIGEFADLANGVLYTIEGDGVNAAFSYAAAIPIAGWYATTAKWAKKTITSINLSKRTLVWYKTASNSITFGDRGLLRKVLGLAKGDARVAHHIIPWDLTLHPAVQKAAKGSNAFHLNEALNGIPLNQAVHSGTHSMYIGRVQAALDAIPSNLGPYYTRVEIDNIITRIRTAITNNPNTHIDFLIF